MAEKKLSPRQKMINLMYLVLTAMLALNVSAEILKAFELVEISIRKSTARIQSKIDEQYSTFEAKYLENKTKVAPYKEKADQIKVQTADLYNFMDSLKIAIMDLAGANEVEGYDEKFKIFRKDDREAGENTMFNEGQALVLKKKIINYRKFLLDIVNAIDTSGRDSTIRRNINKSLSTDSLYNEHEKTWVPWEVANFHEMPAVAEVTMLTKLQNDLKNVQADVLTFLLEKIGEGEFHFNKIEVVVNSKKSYVLLNEPYEAEVFIAAADTTQDPIITLNQGDSSYLKIVNGKGIYTPPTGRVGMFTWGGVLKIKKPGTTNEYLEFPFESDYQVVQPSVAISPTKMNVFYIGVDNPVDITASGVPDDKVRVSMTNGTIRKVGTGKYIVRPRSVDAKGTKTKVSVAAQVGNSTRSLGSMNFRVLEVPDPRPVVGGKSNAVVSKNWLTRQVKVNARLDNFVFDLTFPVVGFKVSLTIRGFTEEVKANGANITAQQKQLIQQAKTGTKIYFEDVKVRKPGGKIANIGTIYFKLR